MAGTVQRFAYLHCSNANTDLVLVGDCFPGSFGRKHGVVATVLSRLGFRSPSLRRSCLKNPLGSQNSPVHHVHMGSLELWVTGSSTLPLVVEEEKKDGVQIGLRVVSEVAHETGMSVLGRLKNGVMTGAGTNTRTVAQDDRMTQI